MSQALAVIPARFGSTRLPGKPLLDRTGRPLVVHAADRAAQARSIALVIIATDDARIADAARAHGHTAVLTRADHANGTSRIAEAVAGLPRGYGIVVNVQGDEPEVSPAVIDRLVERLRAGREPMATVVAPFAADEDPANPHIVKVVLNTAGQALYFSRSLIPHPRAAQAEPERCGGLASAVPQPTYPLKHLGLYAYRREFLERYVKLPATPGEQVEQLEQLRVLEHGQSIACIFTDHAHRGIDTPEDYQAFVTRHHRAAPQQH